MRSHSIPAAVVLLAMSATLFAADWPLFRYAGDGLTIDVTQMTRETGEVAGVIRRGQESWPFKGRVAEGKKDAIDGTFVAGGREYPFTTKIDEENDTFTFTSGGRTYQLKVVEPPKPAGGDAGDNPFGDPAKDVPPKAPPAAPVKPAPGAKPDAGRPAVLKLKQHVFPDVSMGAPAAYTALTPVGWSSKGNVEWQLVGEVPFPQMKFEITSPAGGKIVYVPQMTLSYSNAPGMGQTGVPAPDDFPKWLEEAITRTNKNISNLKLIESHRDAATEKMQDEIDRMLGVRADGSVREAWIITFEYDEAGLHRREELSASYNRYPPFNGINGFFTQTWSIFTSQIVSGPADKFEAMKKDLYAICGTVHPTPGWFTQSQQQIAENSQRRAADIWAAIKRRGEMINQYTDADYAKYKKDVYGDPEQRKRMNQIYESDDYRDTNGGIVNLPIHYKYVYSDGQGSFVLTNNTQDKPGETWKEIEPMK